MKVFERASDAVPAAWSEVLSNEFAAVRLSVDRQGNAPRLRIDDLATGLSVFMDAFQLSGLTSAGSVELTAHMVPRGLGSAD
ncbi:hypothetical protein LJR034_005516 [Caballeronia sp. LjRoot34]|uniref:hypothetical protein n=1 Tax=Caballeronia sp. LjRoot34 TaxID=3342325 RepID=UPI003ED06196